MRHEQHTRMIPPSQKTREIKSEATPYKHSRLLIGAKYFQNLMPMATLSRIREGLDSLHVARKTNTEQRSSMYNLVFLFHLLCVLSPD